MTYWMPSSLWWNIREMLGRKTPAVVDEWLMHEYGLSSTGTERPSANPTDRHKMDYEYKVSDEHRLTEFLLRWS